MKQLDLFENEIIYIPFLNFYEDKTDFAILAYPDKKQVYGVSVFTITHNINNAIFKYSIEEARKIFNKHLKSLCPKKLYKNYGVIKTTYQKFLNVNIKFKKDLWGYEYISIHDIKKQFEIVEFPSIKKSTN